MNNYQTLPQVNFLFFEVLFLTTKLQGAIILLIYSFFVVFIDGTEDFTFNLRLLQVERNAKKQATAFISINYPNPNLG